MKANTESVTRSLLPGDRADAVILRGHGLDIDAVCKVARHGVSARIDSGANLRSRVDRSCAFLEEAVAARESIYGVTTGFGGMANVVVPAEEAAALQLSLLRALKVGVGRPLSREDVRASMLCRANSHLHGGSGIRFELIERFTTLLNAGITPQVSELGSIGASGDLVPLSYIGGCIIGLDGYLADLGNTTVDAKVALAAVGLKPITLRPKEGLALVNGTSVMTGIAAMCAYDASVCVALALGAHALLFQGLAATNQSFHPFIHAHKPHKGQVDVARYMLSFLSGSKMSRDELDGRHPVRPGEPIQDRYSLRCLAQFLGPIVDGLAEVCSQVNVELNSLTDNPIIDTEHRASYHGGNFLGQYIAVAMDHLRYYLGLLAKHLDTQIALVVTPEFSAGLPPSLVGNPRKSTNMGLKGLQIAGNSIMPLISHLGTSIADRFPTHAEQFNQNINSQGMTSAVCARRSIELMQSYLAIALLFGVQAADLRCHLKTGRYNATELLAASSATLYSAVRAVIGVSPSASRPYLVDDGDHSIDHHIAALQADIARGGRVVEALGSLPRTLRSA